MFYVAYLDAHKMKLMNPAGTIELKFTRDVSSNEVVLLDESIENLQVVSRSPERGFALQHGLVVDTYVDLEFNGDIPQFITGKITHVEHDMIEVTTIPAKTAIYIDFAYQGIPEHLPLRKIRIRDAPNKKTDPDQDDTGVSSHTATLSYVDPSLDTSVEWNDEGEMSVHGLDEAFSKSFHDLLEQQYIEADQLMPEDGVVVAGLRFEEALIMNNNNNFELCERFRALNNKTKSVVLPPAWWIPVVVRKDDDDDDKEQGVTDCILEATGSCDDRFLITRDEKSQRFEIARRFPSEPTSYLILSKLFHSTSSLLDQQQQPLVLYYQTLLPSTPVVDVSALTLEFWQKQAPPGTVSVVPAAAFTRQHQQQCAVEAPTMRKAMQLCVEKFGKSLTIHDVVKISSFESVAVAAALPKPPPFERTPMFPDIDTQAYHDDDDASRTLSETLMDIWVADGGAYLCALLRSKTTPFLTLSEDMINSLTEQTQRKLNDFEDMNHVGKIKAASCVRRVLAKRYTSLTDVHKDSAHGSGAPDPVYFDAEYDDTPYDLLKGMEKAFAETTSKPEAFEEFVAHSLIDKHNYQPKIAEEVAATMVARKRLIKEGHFALLDTTKSQFYYRRTRDHKWILDKTVDATTFVDTPTLFCNLDKICMRDAAAPTCETPEDATVRLRYLEQRRAVRELQTRLTASTVHAAHALDKAVESCRQRLRRRRILRYVDLHKYNEFHFSLAARGYEDASSPTSPHVHARNRILGDKDTVRRRKQLADFVVRHCREALVGESPHWWYCNETVPAYPLVPTSLINRRTDHSAEDGVFVDRFTGYTVDKLPWTHEGAKRLLVDDAEKEEEVPLEERSILTTLRRFLGLKEEEDDVDTLKVAQELIKQLPTEPQYKKMTGPRDGAPFLPYALYYDRERVLRTTIALLFVLQTSLTTDDLRGPKKRLASGYPLLNDETELGGLAQMSIVLSKLKSHKRQPWDALHPWNEATIRQALLTRCRTLLVQVPKYSRRLDIQRHRATRTAPPCKSSIMTQPPLIETRVLSYQPMEDGFGEHLKALLAQGNRKQHDAINSLVVKNWALALHVWSSPERIHSPSSLPVQQQQQQPQLLVFVNDEKVDDDFPPSTHSAKYRDATAWAALIWYHHLDRPGPIPDDMRALGLIKEKPEKYDPVATLDEKKQLLESVNLNSTRFGAMMNVVFQQNVVRIPVRKNLHKKQVSALRDLLASYVSMEENAPLGRYLCQLVDAQLSTGQRDDEPTNLALLEELTVQRLAMWTQMRQWLARDQLHRLQVVLTQRPAMIKLIRKMCKPLNLPTWLHDVVNERVVHRFNNLIQFLSLFTPSVSIMVDAIYAHGVLFVMREYMLLAKNHGERDWIANLVASWM
jgi:hypothetical protein